VVGDGDGAHVDGRADGCRVGCTDGCVDGWPVGLAVGTTVGAKVGAWVRTVILRTAQLAVSAMYTFPASSTAIPCGPLNVAKIGLPPPSSTMAIVPVGVILRTVLASVSETYTYPPESTHTPNGRRSVAEMAAPPSPDVPSVPVPATMAMVPADRVRR